MTEKEIDKMFKESIAYQYWERLIDDYIDCSDGDYEELSLYEKYTMINNLFNNDYLWDIIYQEIYDELKRCKNKSREDGYGD